MKKLLALTLTAAMLLAVAGCGGSSSSQAPSSSQPAETKAAESMADTMADTMAASEDAVAPAFEEGQKFDVMEFVSGPANGGWSQIAAAIADKANEHFDGFPITATTGGAVSNPVVMAQGEATIGMNQAIMLTAAMNGDEPFEEPINNLRSICSLDISLLYFVVDASVEANSIDELIASGSKIKIGSLPAGNAATLLMDLTLAEYGTTKEDLCDGDVYITDATGLTDAYSNRQVDLVVRNVALPNAALTELMTGRDSKILALSEDVCNALHEKYDWEIVTIPAGSYPGQDADVLTVAVKTVLAVTEDCPDAVAYFLAKTMYDEKEYFETVQAAYANFTREDMVKGLTVDVHPGAEIFWKEVGLMD